MLPWAVRDLASGTIVGTTRYHDIVAAIDRVEIGYTWYAQQPSADERQHDVQAAAARARVRHAALQGRRPADRQLQLPLAARDRGDRREEGRRPPSPRRAEGRHRPRLGDVQHPRRGVARRQETPGAAARATCHRSEPESTTSARGACPRTAHSGARRNASKRPLDRLRARAGARSRPPAPPSIRLSIGNVAKESPIRAEPAKRPTVRRRLRTRGSARHVVTVLSVSSG